MWVHIWCATGFGGNQKLFVSLPGHMADLCHCVVIWQISVCRPLTLGKQPLLHALMRTHARTRAHTYVHTRPHTAQCICPTRAHIRGYVPSRTSQDARLCHARLCHARLCTQGVGINEMNSGDQPVIGVADTVQKPGTYTLQVREGRCMASACTWGLNRNKGCRCAGHVVKPCAQGGLLRQIICSR